MTNLEATGGVPGPGRIGRVAIGDLLKRAARRFPDRVALTDGARRVTFAELDRDANRFANVLVERGLEPGAKIATICNNSIEFVKALFGIHRAGLVWVPINTMLGSADMDYILGHAEVRFALIDDNLHAQADRRAVLQRRGLDLIAEGRPRYERAILKFVFKRRYPRKIREQGLARMPRAQVERQFFERLEDIDTLLQDRPFLGGEAPNIADFSVAGQLDELVRTSDLKPRILGYARIADWLARC